MADPRARILITADDKASAALRRIRGETEGVSAVFSKLNIALGGLVGGGALTLFAKNAIDSADNLGKLSTRLGASTEALSQYQFVAQQTGVEFRTLTTAFQRSTRRISEAAAGTGEAKKALEELGLSAQALNQLAPDQQFELLADAIQKVEQPADRVRLAVKLFDSEGAALLQTMEGGSEAIRALRQEADGLGLTLDKNVAEQAARANDALGRIGAAAKGLGVSLTAALAPAIEAAANWLQVTLPSAAQFAVDAFQSLQKFIQQTGSFITRELGGLSDRFAQVAEFVGADAVGRALRKTADDYLQSSEIFEAAAVRIGEAQRIIFEPPQITSAATDYADIFTGGGVGNIAQVVTQAKQQGEDFTKVLQRLQDQLDPAAAKTRVYLESVEVLDRAWREGLISGERYESLFEMLTTDSEAAATAQRELAEEQRRAFELIKNLDPGSSIRDQILEVQQLRDTFPELSDALADVEFNLQEQWDEIGGQAEEAADKTRNAWQELGPVFSSAFEDALVEGKKFSDILDSLEQDIIRIATRKLVTEPAGNAVAGFFGGDFFSSLFGSAFGGARALGGAVNAGRAYLVGENGPELFSPGQNGAVLNARQTRAALADQNITVNVNGVTDFDSFKRSTTQVQRAARRALVS